MFSFSASYLQIKSGLQIPQNYKYLISNKKVFLYKYAKILTCVLTIIRGVVLTVWLMEQQSVSAQCQPLSPGQTCHMTASRCIDKQWAYGIQVLKHRRSFFQEIWLDAQVSHTCAGVYLSWLLAMTQISLPGVCCYISDHPPLHRNAIFCKYFSIFI